MSLAFWNVILYTGDGGYLVYDVAFVGWMVPDIQKEHTAFILKV